MPAQWRVCAPGTSLVKAAKQSSTGALVRGERSPSLDNTSRANVATGALGTKGRPQSTSARLASAESMLPRAALLNLRQHAIARSVSLVLPSFCERNMKV